MHVNYKRYALYLVRWQLSTPLLAPIVAIVKGSSSPFGTAEDWIAATVANLIGGLIFFWVDSYIFRARILNNHWEVEEDVHCADCNKLCRGYRLVKGENYDRSDDPHPEFRCEKHSKIKHSKLKKKLALK